MVRVMAQGVFDLLHPGHVHYLTEAKKLGDELWVVVARDSTARAFKHEPITNEVMRREMVAALKPVDKALLGNEGNIYDILDVVHPDVIALGYDQVHTEQRILEECRRRGLERTKVVRLPQFEGDLMGTRRIVRKVAEWWAVHQKLQEVEGTKPLVPDPKEGPPRGEEEAQ
jgi:FAD synthetase